MQHLREVGVQEDGVDSVLLEAPSSRFKSKAKKNLLPPEALPSTSELPRNYESQEAIPSSIAGFKPDMDPHLREVLEALEDDSFVDEDTEDEFFGELLEEGERQEGESFEFEYHEALDGEDVDTGDAWEARFAKFKKEQAAAPPHESDSDVDDQSEGQDTISGLPKLSVIGRKRRRGGTSDASGYSMSSLSMARTEALQTLDERFDQVHCSPLGIALIFNDIISQMMEKQYSSGQGQEDDGLSDNGSDEAPQLITSREDFEALMDDFLTNYEILGRKIKPKLEGDSGAEKLDTLRRAMGQDNRVRVGDDDSESEEDQFLMRDEQDKPERWDCETILSEYN
jgi:protein LTV1